MSSIPPLSSTLELAVLRGALEEAPLGVATLAGDTVAHANTALERLLCAEPGQLEGQPLSAWLPEDALSALTSELRQRRVFDGRLRIRTLRDEPLTCEVHAERYQSGANTGGFVIVRDVSLEMSTLGRLVEALGGATFRVNVDRRAFEYVSPRVVDLLGLDPLRILDDPACLGALVSPVDQSRLGGAYQDLVRGRTSQVEEDVVVRLSGGRTDKLRVVATGRSDSHGVVRHVEGVVTGAGTAKKPSTPPPAAHFSGLNNALAMLDVCGDLLHEAARLTTSACAEVRTVKALLHAGESAPLETTEPLARLDTLNDALATSNAISRRVRRAMEGRVSTVRVTELLDTIRANLSPLVRPARLGVVAHGVDELAFSSRVDEVILALMQLVLRAHHLVARGDVTVNARPAPGVSRELYVEIAAEPSESASTSAGAPSSGEPPRGLETDKRLVAATSLLSEAGCRVESDEIGEQRVRTVVELASVFREATEG